MRHKYSLLVIFLLISSLIKAQYITLSTPADSDIEGLIQTETLTDAEIENLNYLYSVTYPQATLLESATMTYNSHCYAWHLSTGYSRKYIKHTIKNIISLKRQLLNIYMDIYLTPICHI